MRRKPCLHCSCPKRDSALVDKVVIGSTNKGDCAVSITRCERQQINIVSENDHLFGVGLQSVVRESLATLEADQLCVDLEDHGAVDYVVKARLEAAVRAVMPQIEPMPVKPQKRRTLRDRLRRTRLYAPGNNPRLLMGVELHGSDCVLIDLEDSVPEAEKTVARILAKHLLAEVRFSEVFVRINNLEACGRQDLAEVMLASPHGICLPKTESSSDVAKLEREIALLEGDLGIEPGSTLIMPIVETGKGVLNAPEIACASRRVAMMAFGAEDYTRDVGARRTQESLLYPRSRIVAACAACGIQSSDTVYANVEDNDGLINETRHIRDLGFSGKGAINPRQIRVIHEVFRPTDEEVARARQVVATATEAEAKGIGAVSLDGHMVDKPVLERAKQVIDLSLRIEDKWR